MNENLALPQFYFLIDLPLRLLDCCRRRRGIEEKNADLTGLGTWERVCIEHCPQLLSSADDDANRLSCIRLKACLKRLFHGRRIVSGGEYKIAGLNVGSHVKQACRCGHKAQLGHGQFAGATNIDRA